MCQVPCVMPLFGSGPVSFWPGKSFVLFFHLSLFRVTCRNIYGHFPIQLCVNCIPLYCIYNCTYC